jgi:hypothetical protein
MFPSKWIERVAYFGMGRRAHLAGAQPSGRVLPRITSFGESTRWMVIVIAWSRVISPGSCRCAE